MKQVGEYMVPDAEVVLCRNYGRKGGVDLEILREALPLIPGRRLAVDGGAHVGSWTRVLAQEFMEVIAVEPEPKSFECLLANTDHLENVRRYRWALWDTPRLTVQMEQRRKHNTGTYQTVVVTPGTGLLTICIDAMCEGRDVDFIKLDIEGAELQALRGAERTLSRCRPAVLFEWAQKTAARYGTSKEEIEGYLRAFGYRETKTWRENYLWQT